MIAFFCSDQIDRFFTLTVNVFVFLSKSVQRIDWLKLILFRFYFCLTISRERHIAILLETEKVRLEMKRVVIGEKWRVNIKKAAMQIVYKKYHIYNIVTLYYNRTLKSLIKQRFRIQIGLLIKLFRKIIIELIVATAH